MPPIAITISTPITSTMEFVSKIACFFQSDISISSLGRDQRRFAARDEGVARIDGAPQVPDHDQRADEEERAAERSYDVERMHGLDGLDEGIFEEAELGEGAPHQPLQNPGHPHCRDVEHDADGGDPEVPVDELE